MSILNKIIATLSGVFSKNETETAIQVSPQPVINGNLTPSNMEIVALLDAEINARRFKYLLYIGSDGKRGYKIIGSPNGIHSASQTFTICVGPWLYGADTDEALEFIAKHSTWPKNASDPISPGQVLPPQNGDDKSRTSKSQTTISLVEAESMLRSSITAAIEEPANVEDKKALELLLLKLYGKTHVEVFNAYFSNPNDFSVPAKEATVSRHLKEARGLIKDLPGSPELPSWAAWRIPAHREAFYHRYVKKFNLTISN